VLGTDRNDFDSDDYGLSDLEEHRGWGTELWKTDPTRADTDLDGASDGEEDLNRDGARDANETDPLDSGDQGLKLRSGTWMQRDHALLEILGAEPGAQLTIYASRSVLWANIETGGLDTLSLPLLPIAISNANAAGESHWVVEHTGTLTSQGSVWLQAIEVGTDGTRRITQPLLVTEGRAGY